jgi:hypothetical protein
MLPVLSQLGIAESKKWFDFCYCFALRVDLCCRSLRTLTRCPHGAGTDILTTVRRPTFFPNASTALHVLIDFVCPFSPALSSRFHAGASLAA